MVVFPERVYEATDNYNVFRESLTQVRRVHGGHDRPCIFSRVILAYHLSVSHPHACSRPKRMALKPWLSKLADLVARLMKPDNHLSPASLSNPPFPYVLELKMERYTAHEKDEDLLLGWLGYIE